MAPVLERLGGGDELTHLGSSLPMSICGCWSYVGGRLHLWVVGFVFGVVVVVVWSLVVVGICGQS